MRNQDYKTKYNDLKMKFMDAVDAAFRLGYESGANNAQLQQAQQQTQAMQSQQMGAENPETQVQQPEMSDGSELDQHINELESMVHKSDPGCQEYLFLKKSLNDLKELQKGIEQTYDLKKSEKAIQEIGKILKSPFQLSKSATKNMSESAKKALSSQEKIVSDLMDSFAKEEAAAAQAISKTLNFEQLLKG